jgi:hypothetical protein
MLTGTPGNKIMVDRSFEVPRTNDRAPNPLLVQEGMPDFGRDGKSGRTPWHIEDLLTQQERVQRRPGVTSSDDMADMLTRGAKTPSEKELAEAVRLMREKKDDPKAGMEAAEPKFKQAIKESQTAIEGIGEKASELSKAPKEQVMGQMLAKTQADLGVAKALADVTVPPRLQGKITEDDLRDKLEAEVAAYVKTKPGDFAFRGLEQDLKEFPDVLKAAQAQKQAGDAEPLKSMEQLVNQYGRAMTDGFGARMLYGQALKEAGRPEEAWQQVREAMKMIGQNPPEEEPGTFRVRT